MGKFSVIEVTELRNELVQGGLDSFQTAEVLQAFLAGRGYGVSPDAALIAAGRVDCAGCSVKALQQELENLALVM